MAVALVGSSRGGFLLPPEHALLGKDPRPAALAVPLSCSGTQRGALTPLQSGQRIECDASEGLATAGLSFVLGRWSYSPARWPLQRRRFLVLPPQVVDRRIGFLAGEESLGLQHL